MLRMQKSSRVLGFRAKGSVRAQSGTLTRNSTELSGEQDVYSMIGGGGLLYGISSGNMVHSLPKPEFLLILTI